MRNRFAVLLVILVLFGAACAGNPPMVVNEAPIVAPTYTTKTINGNLWAVPSGMELEQFPVLGHKLTEEEQVRLKLRLARLEKDTVLYNENRKRHSFPAELVKAGTKVWLDEDGEVRYLESCGNRAELVEQSTKPAAATLTIPITNTNNTTDNERRGWNFGWLLDAILGLLALGLLLALLMLIGAGLYWLYKQLYNLFNRPITPTPPIPATPPVTPPTTPAPLVAPFPVTPAPTTPSTPPAPAVPARTTRHFGPFKAVRIEDKGFEGYWVIGDGHPIGIFKDPVFTEDAGMNGHYVVVSNN